VTWAVKPQKKKTFILRAQASSKVKQTGVFTLSSAVGVFIVMLLKQANLYIAPLDAGLKDGVKGRERAHEKVRPMLPDA
jgi:hypothetical protein